MKLSYIRNNKYCIDNSFYDFDTVIQLCLRSSSNERNFMFNNNKIRLKKGKLLDIKQGLNFYTTVQDIVFDMDLSMGVDFVFDKYRYMIDLKDDQIKRFLREVDEARVLDCRLQTIITPLGATDLSCISTGLKVLLLSYVANIKNLTICINYTDFGSNIFSYIVELCKNTPIAIYLMNAEVNLKSLSLQYDVAVYKDGVLQ